MPISTCILEDETINCCRAFERGYSSMSSIVGKNFEDFKFVRKNRVSSLQGLTSKVKIGNEDIPMNSETLFRRIALLKKLDTELYNYFSYELASCPLSLFNECGMRKSSKSDFNDLFTPNNRQNQLSRCTLRH
ncbi:hypothetical protein AVEN_178865-1 [Araneus ventricosus]|uniref:Uncharacterized protein n=1 Tax=Araneus ventricosus TaxID=182803 RepID=A0A4Y2BDZ8_ARAVE|nr:hypothetical protein AVEN_178865-1 [Araneus ventricosus]